MTALRRHATCTGPHVTAAPAAGIRSVDGQWPVEDPDEAIAVSYLAAYYRHTWIAGRPNSAAANRLLRCVLQGARQFEGS